VQLVAVDPGLQPEHVRSIADGRIQQLAALTRATGAGDVDGALAGRLDRPQLPHDTGELGTDLWRLGQWWVDRVAGPWERTVAASLESIRSEAERRYSGRRA
jgi:hypothetical protein